MLLCFCIFVFLCFYFSFNFPSANVLTSTLGGSVAIILYVILVSGIERIPTYLGEWVYRSLSWEKGGEKRRGGKKGKEGQEGWNISR